MIGDCETNFVGVVSELKELISKLDQNKVQQDTAYRGVKWNFNPPVTIEELITAVAGVESVLSSTYLPVC